MHVHSFPLDRVEARSTIFTEQEAYWRLPMDEVNIVADVAVTKGVDSLSLWIQSSIKILYDRNLYRYDYQYLQFTNISVLSIFKL